MKEPRQHNVQHQNRRFISFEIDADDHRLQVDEWLDVTHRQNLCRHNRGIGIGHGALAMDVLQALNASSAIPPFDHGVNP